MAPFYCTLAISAQDVDVDLRDDSGDTESEDPTAPDSSRALKRSPSLIDALKRLGSRGKQSVHPDTRPNVRAYYNVVLEDLTSPLLWLTSRLCQRHVVDMS